MNALKFHTSEINENGFTIINHIFSEAEVNKLIQVIDQVTYSNSNFRKDNDLFAIRNFIGEVPQIQPDLALSTTDSSYIRQLYSGLREREMF